MRILDEFKFCFRGFSTSRMVLVLDALNILLCSGCLAFPEILTIEIYGDAAVALFFFALILCFSPPYNAPKFYVCWPLTGATLVFLMLLAQ